MSNLTHRTGHGEGYGNKTLLMMPSLCTLETCDLSLASFDYLPTVAGNGIFAGIFALFVIVQLFFGIKHKTWGYMTAMVIGLVMECVGYIARILVHNTPFDNNIWLIYLILLTIAPAFLTAAIYLCLARIVTVYGESLSRFKPRTYTLIFCTCDFISLVLQGAGGGIASTANTISSRDLGKNMMLAGLIFQVVSLVLFAICCSEFAFRVKKNMGNRNPAYISLCSSKLFKGFLWGLFISSFTILVRSVYRCVELAGGFDSSLFRGDEAVFMILEGAMIVVATGCLTLLHPGLAFQGAWDAANFSFRTSKNKKVDRMSSSDEEMGNVELSDVSAARK